MCKVMFLWVAGFVMGTYHAEASCMFAHSAIRLQMLAAIPPPSLALLYRSLP